MSREKAQSSYESEVKSFGCGARIKAYKAHIGETALVFLPNRLTPKELKVIRLIASNRSSEQVLEDNHSDKWQKSKH